MARVVGAWFIAGLLLSASCSDDAANEAGGADTGTPLQNGDAGPSGAGSSGGGASSGASGSAGRRAMEAGRGGSTAQAGTRAQGGSGPAGGTEGSAGGGGAAAGAGGAGGTTEISDACASDADCEMCTVPLGPEENCCTGCPTPHTKERCAAERTAAKMCVAMKRPAPPIPVCPAILCVEPGSAVCENGMCIRGDGTR